jgi:DnaJ-class molecular chaperone
MNINNKLIFPEMADLYKTLGVDSKASEQEIKKAYRKLSLENHPDRNKDIRAHEKFKEINEAYETLGDVDKRKQYDHQQTFGGFPPSMGGGFPFPHGSGVRVHHGMPPDFGNIFETFFGGSVPHPMEEGLGGHGPRIRVFHHGTRTPQPPKKPDPIEKQVSITLEQAYQGFTINLEVERRVFVNGIETTERESIPVMIPQGVEHQECIVLSEVGNRNAQQMRGDIHLNLDLLPHSLFVRKGLDLYCNRTITLKEALCGFSLDVEHLSGKKLRISNQAQTNIVFPGYSKEVPTYGMVKGNTKGKMVFVFDVTFPTSLTETQRETLQTALP